MHEYVSIVICEQVLCGKGAIQCLRGIVDRWGEPRGQLPGGFIVLVNCFPVTRVGENGNGPTKVLSLRKGREDGRMIGEPLSGLIESINAAGSDNHRWHRCDNRYALISNFVIGVPSLKLATIWKGIHNRIPAQDFVSNAKWAAAHNEPQCDGA